MGSVALLAACATPASVPLGASESQTVATLGRPAAVFELPDGGRRLYYPLGGAQQFAWMLEFDREGRLVANDQVHSEVFFAKVRIDRDTRDDVLRLLGPPAWTEYYGPSRRTGWVYPYAPNSMWNFITTVIFDEAGVVRSVQGGPDPRFDRGGNRW
ncbi:MAG: hypothetical protein ACK6C0_01985 [Betaproteobacteria bacterium]